MHMNSNYSILWSVEMFTLLNKDTFVKQFFSIFLENKMRRISKSVSLCFHHLWLQQWKEMHDCMKFKLSVNISTITDEVY